MRKIIIAILAILYFSSSTGAIVYLHNCMNKLVGCSLDQHTAGTFYKYGIEKDGCKDSACCKKENKFFKGQPDQHITVPVYHWLPTNKAVFPFSCFQIPLLYIATVAKGIPLSHSPPKSSTAPVYLRNCAFLL